jgi:MinD superfamily P-loop ATPase
LSYKISIASGKGGTGKTTLAVNLFHYFAIEKKLKTQLVDCDVEEPNDLIFFPDAGMVNREDIYKMIPVISPEKCNYCRKCVEFCEFNAIVVMEGAKFTDINDTLCHSCGACLYACSEGAIHESRDPIGIVNNYRTPEGYQIIEGQLKVGSAMQTMLIKELKGRANKRADVLIHDAPPGTSCSVVETISDSDFVILVAEPTLFGFHDFKLMVDLIKKIQLPFGVVINKAGFGDDAIYKYLEKENIHLLGEVPFLKEYASAYAQGNLFEGIPTRIIGGYKSIITKLEELGVL